MVFYFCIPSSLVFDYDINFSYSNSFLNKNANVFLFLISVVFSHLMLFSKCILVLFELGWFVSSACLSSLFPLFVETLFHSYSLFSYNSIVWTENFQMYKLRLEKAEEPSIKLPTFVGSWRKQNNFRKTSTSASLTMLKPFTMWITTNCGKLLKRWEYQATLPVSWETCMQVKKQQLES